MVEVRVENVRKTYGKVEALKGASLTFASGAMTAILGPSGCGKTTLLRSIAGFIQVDEGRVFLGGDEVTQLPPQRRGTAMVFQNYALWPHMTIFGNVAYGLRLQKVPEGEIRRRVLKVLELVEIGNLADVETRKPAALSGGQQQRVALARALVVEPKVLLMDEPLSNLDAKVRQRLRAELRRLQKQVGITAIYVTHDQEEALALADTVVLMDQGRIVQTGTPQDIYLKPDTAFAAEFLGVSNQLEGEAADGRTGDCRPDRAIRWEGAGESHRHRPGLGYSDRRPGDRGATRNDGADRDAGGEPLSGRALPALHPTRRRDRDGGQPRTSAWRRRPARDAVGQGAGVWEVGSAESREPRKGMSEELKRKAIILDTDPGIGTPGSDVDDGLAIALGRLHPACDLLGLTITY